MIGLLVGTLREFKSDDTERSQTKQVFGFNIKNTLGVKKSLIPDSIFESWNQIGNQKFLHSDCIISSRDL